MEAMSAVASAVKDERWADAQRALQEVQRAVEVLLRGVGGKQREAMMAPTPDKGDRE
jgi:hypothetical protein